jgi:hypothetical protein
MGVVGVFAWQGWLFLGMLIGLPIALANILAKK